ncbi:phosphorylated carbohydrates phosphatase [Spirochaetia bacterium]|nr:phosphorylated carbohydrates phosphatase [Spirochaetia bacterium]
MKRNVIAKGIIFDMDGTLLDTEKLEIKLFLEVCQEIGQPAEENFLKTRLGYTLKENETAYKKEYGVHYPFNKIFELVNQKEADYAEKNGLPLMPGALKILNKCKDQELVIAVATSSDLQRTKWKLSKAGIIDFFDVFACGNEVEKGKPEPDIFLLAAKRLNLPVEDIIGFEDSTAGLKGLYKAGIRSVFIKDLITPPDDVLKKVWYTCNSFEEALLELFGGNSRIC